MALNSSGPISLAGTTTGESIEKELGGTGTTLISLGDTSVRTLAGVSSGAITMPTDFWGKSNTITATYVIIAGGGGGSSGGGGAGGLISGTLNLTSGAVYTATVGTGGAGAPASSIFRVNYNASVGNNSTLTGVPTTALGGGGGGRFQTANNSSGGSGGGGGSCNPVLSLAGASGTAGQGNPGGPNNPISRLGIAGGGGGKGSAGPTGGTGEGINLTSIIGVNINVAGGGVGGNGSSPASIGMNSLGSGGTGYNASGSPLGQTGYNGAIFLSIPTSQYTGTTTGSPTVTTSGSNTILQFNSTGTYTA